MILPLVGAVALGAPFVTLTGTCPGPIEVDITEATPGGTLAAATADSSGSYVLPAGGPCAGYATGLSPAGFTPQTTITASGAGAASFTVPVPLGACGTWAQVVDVGACAFSNPVQVPSASGCLEPLAIHVPADQPTIQLGIDAAPLGGTVCVAPGTYLENVLIVDGLTLVSSGGAAVTTIDGASILKSTVEIDLSRGAAVTYASCPLCPTDLPATVRGFTIENGRAPLGGGVLVNTFDTPPVLLDEIVVTDNAAVDGGGIWFGSPDAETYHYPPFAQNLVTITNSAIVGNVAAANGGGLAGPDVWENGTLDGTLTVKRTAIVGNTAAGLGGGVYGAGGSGTDGLGHGVRLSDTVVAGNTAAVGGGLHFEGHWGSTIVHTQILGNTPNGVEVDLVWTEARMTMSHSAVVGNGPATEGGGFRAGNGEALVLDHTIVAGNIAQTGGGAVGTYLIPRYGCLCANYDDDIAPTCQDPAGSNGNISVDPRFVAFSPALPWRDWDLHLAPASPLIDAGDPAVLDPDGTRADIGFYGGPGADQSYYADGDGDGMYDAWEALHGLDTSTNDSALDPDGDGLTHLAELNQGTLPLVADSDGDGVNDAAEVAAGTDPRDPANTDWTTFVPIDTGWWTWCP